MKRAILYGSSTGNTEVVAEQLEELLGIEIEMLNVADVNPEQASEYDVLICGIPTWNTGELQEDWIAFYDDMDGVDFSKTKIAIFGLGDAVGYGENFLDGVGILYRKFDECGAQMGAGFWSEDDYEFDASLALLEPDDDKFCGLGIDEDNESDKTADRLSDWVDQIKEELSLA